MAWHISLNLEGVFKMFGTLLIPMDRDYQDLCFVVNPEFLQCIKYLLELEYGESYDIKSIQHILACATLVQNDWLEKAKILGT